MPAPPTPGRRERPGAARVVVAAHRRWIAAAAALVATTATSLALPASAHGSDETPTQWQIDARAEALQRAPEPAEKPVICIIDTGVTPTPDLDIVSRTALDGGTPGDVTAIPGHYGHGTTVAHMAAAKVNGWGSSGAFPHARIASVRIFDRLDQRVPWQRYVRALERCSDVRPKPVVAVISLGAQTSDHYELEAFRNGVIYARDRHSMSVVAAGGNTSGPVDVPARFPQSVSVGASKGRGEPCEFSGRGSDIDVSPVGCELHQSGWDGSGWDVEGTSFSTPIVAGILAAIRAFRPDLTLDEAEESVLAASRAAGEILDATAALQTVGLDAIVDRQVASTGRSMDPGQPAPPGAEATPDADGVGPPLADLSPHVEQQPQVPRCRLPRPRVRVHRRNRQLFIRVSNRRANWLVVVTHRRRHLHSHRGAVVRIRDVGSPVAIRFESLRCRSLPVRLSI